VEDRQRRIEGKRETESKGVREKQRERERERKRGGGGGERELRYGVFFILITC